MRKQIGDFDARLAVLPELPRAAQQRRACFDELALDLAKGRRQLLSVKPVERGLRVKGLHMTGRADHIQKDHGLGLRLEMRTLGRERVEEFAILPGVLSIRVSREQI